MTNEPSAPIVVIGSANQDYLLRVPAVPAPGETTLAHTMRRSPGGKGANQAVAAARLGADVRFVGCVGDDDDGALLLRELRAEGVTTTDVEIIGREPTGIALVMVDDSGENSIVVVPGANFALTAARVQRVLVRQPRDAVVLIQAEVPVAIVTATSRAAREAGARLVLNLAPYVALEDQALAPCDPLVVNESEAAALTGRAASTPEDALEVARDLLARCRSVVLTLGAQGAVWASPTGAGHVPAPAVADVVDTTGAGDAFAGALAVRLASGRSLEDAVELGVRAGSFAVTSEGAQSSYPRRNDLLETAERR